MGQIIHADFSDTIPTDYAALYEQPRIPREREALSPYGLAMLGAFALSLALACYGVAMLLAAWGAQ